VSIFSRTRHAILPEDYEEATIDSMVTGERGYTVPWAMWVDADRNCWLHPKYTIHADTCGTVQMRVELREDGYHVWLVPGEKYQPRASPGYCSPEDTEYLPVVELHR
jgi:hypothetical protein